MPYPVGDSDHETTICQHNASAPGAITHMQFTYTDLAQAYGFARFRAYIDGETEPSIDVTMEVRFHQVLHYPHLLLRRADRE